MQIDPLTGEIVPSDPQQQIPLAFRMLENAPGFAAAAGFAAFRGSNTIMAGGGFLDDTRFGPLASNRAAKFRVFGESGLSGTNAKQYVGSSARRQRAAAANKQGFLRSSRVNNVTARPRALRRLHSLSVFGPASANMYTPFSASALASRSKTITSKAGVQASPDAFGPGLLSFVTAGRRADRLEIRAGRSGARGARARAKLGNVDQSISRLAGMNNATILSTPSAVQQARVRPGTSTLTAQQRLANARASVAIQGNFYDQSMAKAVSARTGVAAVGTSAPGVIGVRGNLLASSMAGTGTRFAAGYFRGAMGFANVAGLEGKALEGAQRAVSGLGSVLENQGLKRSGQTVAAKALEEGLFKTLGAKRVGQAMMTRQGAAVIGARTIGMAIPGLNMVMAASLVYDLGKMAGEVVKSGVNLVRDADKSLRGTIHKPMFGMGYRDTEAAATSRSRGVMAIQNSRLNARSVLGSEAGMMAAHFG